MSYPYVIEYTNPNTDGYELPLNLLPADIIAQINIAGAVGGTGRENISRGNGAYLLTSDIFISRNTKITLFVAGRGQNWTESISPKGGVGAAVGGDAGACPSGTGGGGGGASAIYVGSSLLLLAAGGGGGGCWWTTTQKGSGAGGLPESNGAPNCCGGGLGGEGSRNGIGGKGGKGRVDGNFAPAENSLNGGDGQNGSIDLSAARKMGKGGNGGYGTNDSKLGGGGGGGAGFGGGGGGGGGIGHNPHSTSQKEAGSGGGGGGGNYVNNAVSLRSPATFWDGKQW